MVAAQMKHRSVLFPALAACLSFVSIARCDVELNHMFGDHMVLQQGIRNKVWGKAAPGEKVEVTLSAQTQSATTDANGNWAVHLDPIQEYGGPHILVVKGKNTLTFSDVLIGEVWVCAGQSNMQWNVDNTNDADLEKASAKYPGIRLLFVPQVGTQVPQWNFNGAWQVCDPGNVGNFSAVGYLFGRQIHQILEVPVGLINNAWGGSAAEAWVRRDKLAADGRFNAILERWTKIESDLPANMAAYPAKVAEWEKAVELAKAEGKPEPKKPQSPDAQMNSQYRPGNIHCGMLNPSIGYGIRGVIWYQGETNAGRAYQYRDLFPFLVKTWREEWGIGDFAFYWVQLADFMAEKNEPSESAWAELREAQTMSLGTIPNSGQAVIIDLGESKDIHPKNKQDVARRLARLALTETYKLPGFASRSPLYKSMEKQGAKILLTFDHVRDGWRPFDVEEPIGFTVAGADRKFVGAKAVILPDGRIEVSSESVPDPVAVRYAWADNPVCNMFSKAGLPLTPFRTDDFPGVTAEAK